MTVGSCSFFTAPLLIVVCACGAAAAQAAGLPASQGSRAPASRPASRPAWPKLDANAEEQVKGWIARLSHKDPAEAAKAEAALREAGAAVAPSLITKLSDAHENRNEVFLRILDRMVTKEHAVLLVPYLQDKRAAVRKFAATNISLYATPELKPILTSMRKDQEPEIALLAEFALARIGDPSALAPIFAATKEHWKKKAAEIRAAAAGLKGEPTTAFLIEKLDSRDLGSELAALRLLAVAGTKQCAPRIAILLDSTSHLHKKEAINALRGIVDGEQPLDDLSVFDGIEMAKEWKQKVRGM